MNSLFFPAVVAAVLFFSSAFAEPWEPPKPIDLGRANPYVVLAGSAVTSTGALGTIVTGDIGLYPGTAISGFPPGILYGASYAANTAAFDAQGSLLTAYNEAVGLPFNKTLTSMDLGSMILHPNVYKFAGSATLNGVLTLDAGGDAGAVWVFQIESTLLVAQDSSVVFKDGVGNPDYVYWQVGSSATLGQSSTVVGNIMAFAAITVNNAATVNGRCLARNAAVSLDRAVLNIPTTVSFHSTQNIEGISLAEYNSDLSVNEATFKEAIAESMTGVIPSNIENFVVTAGPTSAATAYAKSQRALTTDSIVLNYDVIVASTMTAEELQAQLSTAVSDGSFNDDLHAAALDNGATDLEGTTSDSIDTQTIADDDTTATSSSDSSSADKNTLSGGAIAGIVIGCVVGLALIAILIFLAMFHCCASPVVQKSSGVATTEV